MNYVGPAPDISYYDDQMHRSERKEFLSCYETTTKNEIFDNRRMLERYCQADVTELERRVGRFADTS